MVHMWIVKITVQVQLKVWTWYSDFRDGIQVLLWKILSSSTGEGLKWRYSRWTVVLRWYWSIDIDDDVLFLAWLSQRTNVWPPGGSLGGVCSECNPHSTSNTPIDAVSPTLCVWSVHWLHQRPFGPIFDVDMVDKEASVLKSIQFSYPVCLAGKGYWQQPKI